MYISPSVPFLLLVAVSEATVLKEKKAVIVSSEAAEAVEAADGPVPPHPCEDDPESSACLASQVMADLASLLPADLYSTLKRTLCKVNRITTAEFPTAIVFWMKNDFMQWLAPVYLFLKMSLGLLSPDAAFLVYVHAVVFPDWVSGYFPTAILCYEEEE